MKSLPIRLKHYLERRIDKCLTLLVNKGIALNMNPLMKTKIQKKSKKKESYVIIAKPKSLIKPL